MFTVILSAPAPSTRPATATSGGRSAAGARSPLDQVPERAPQPVEPPDDQGVAWPEHCQHLGQLGPLVEDPSSGARENPLAACCFKASRWRSRCCSAVETLARLNRRAMPLTVPKNCLVPTSDTLISGTVLDVSKTRSRDTGTCYSKNGRFWHRW